MTNNSQTQKRKGLNDAQISLKRWFTNTRSLGAPSSLNNGFSIHEQTNLARGGNFLRGAGHIPVTPVRLKSFQSIEHLLLLYAGGGKLYQFLYFVKLSAFLLLFLVYSCTSITIHLSNHLLTLTQHYSVVDLAWKMSIRLLLRK